MPLMYFVSEFIFLFPKHHSDPTQNNLPLNKGTKESSIFIFFNHSSSKITEEGILRDTERVEDGIRTVDSPKIVTNASNIARRANRVLQVAQQEAENSEDPAFVDNVNRASEQLRTSKLMITDMLNSCK